MMRFRRRKRTQNTPLKDTTLEIIDQALGVFIIIDEDGIIRQWSKKACETLGYEAEEIVGHSLNKELVPERLREAHRHGMENLLKSGTAKILGRPVVLPHLHKDGHEIPLGLFIYYGLTIDGKQHFRASLFDHTIESSELETLVVP